MEVGWQLLLRYGVTSTLFAALIWLPAQAGSTKDAKDRIFQDLRDKELTVSVEAAKLDALYKSAHIPDPVARADELAASSEKTAEDAVKMAQKQLATGPVIGVKKGVESALRGVDVVRKWQEMLNRGDAVIDDLMRQQSPSDADLKAQEEIRAQEKKVQRARIDHGYSKLAASILLPMLAAMEEQERIDEKRQKMVENHRRGEPEAQRQSARYRPPPPGPALRSDPLSMPNPVGMTPPTRGRDSQPSAPPAGTRQPPPPKQEDVPPPAASPPPSPSRAPDLPPKS